MSKQDIPRAGYHVAPWCQAVGIGRTKFYALPPEQQPLSVVIGIRRIITESPAAWLARISEQQRSELLRRKVA